MKISVAMATYNGERYIKQQLDSLLNQTLKIDEFVIVDDCSYDETYKIVCNYAEKNADDYAWTILRHSCNAGYKKTFYEAIKYAKGDIIFLCDQDDIWCINKVEDMIKLFNENSCIKLLACSFSMIDNNGHLMEAGKTLFTENNGLILYKNYRLNSVHAIDFKTVCERNISMGCTMAFKNEIARKYLTYSSCDMPHDWELAFIAGLDNSLFYYNKSLIQYRLHGQNTIGLKKQRSDINEKYRIQEYNKYIKCYDYFYKVYSDNLPEERRKTIICLRRFYCERVDVLENKRLIKSVALLFKYVICLKISAIGAIVDLL